MKWGLFTSGYTYESLENAFRDAMEYGYHYIELWGGRPHAFAPDLLRGYLSDIIRLIERYEMPVEVYTPEHNAYPYNYMLGDNAQFYDCMTYFAQTMYCGKAMGAEYVLFSLAHGGTAGVRKREGRLVKALDTIQDLAEKIGQKVLLENLTPFESNQYTRLHEYAELINNQEHTMIYGMCDVVVPFVQKENPIDYYQELGAKMAHLHLVDSDGKSETHYIPGEGIMDLAALLHSFQELGYQGRATIELVTHYIANPRTASRKAIEAVRAWEI